MISDQVQISTKFCSSNKPVATVRSRNCPFILLKVSKKRITEQMERQYWWLIALTGWNGYLQMNLRVKWTNVLVFVGLNGSFPNFVEERLVINNTQHNRSTQYASYNSICPYHKRETGGGRSLAISAARLWNNVPLNTRKPGSIEFKNSFINLKQSSRHRKI